MYPLTFKQYLAGNRPTLSWMPDLQSGSYKLFGVNPGLNGSSQNESLFVVEHL